MGHAVNRTPRGLVIAFLLLLGVFAIAGAQEANQIGQIYITDSNTDTVPSIQLRLYGKDGQGNPIDFATEPLFISHNGFPVDEIVFDGTTPVGTLTVFLIDAAGGTSDQIPSIIEAVRQFASPGNMEEQRDYVAVYQIRTDGPQELLPPTQFHNGVHNLFNTGQLQAEEGATSLYTSVIDMIGRVADLKPNPAMAASIVLISDGTDPGTSETQPSDVTQRAADAGIPIHTLHIDNPALGAGRELGRVYMQDLSTGSRGVAAELADAAGLAAVWTRIAGFRDHSWIHYIVPEPTGGASTVEVSLANNRDMRATTEVFISTVAPNVVINLPRESRSLILPDLDDPVDLQLSTAVSWLDGETREVTAAHLRVNGVQTAEIPVSSLESFTVTIPNLIFGDNRLEVVVTDNQQLTSTSSPVIINVAQGERLEVPEALQPAGRGFNWTWLLCLPLLVALAAGGFWLWRGRTGTPAPSTGGSSRRRRRGARPPVESTATPESKDAYGVAEASDVLFTGSAYETPFVMAHLEVMSAQTLMPEELTLGDVEVRIGRSPAQAQIAFRDDITVSRYHAVLRLEGNRYRIYDAGSTSGTYVNDQQVPDYGLQLTDGDEVQLGAVRLRYRQL